MANSFELLQPALFLVVFLVIALLSLNVLAAKNVKYPPVIKGWIPWLGCAIDFGKEPLNFIKKSTDKHGVIFTIYAAGQRMTFLTDVSDFYVFFNSPHADFQRAFEGEVKKTVGINKIDFFANHRNVHDLIKGRLSSSNLHKLTPKVGNQLEEYIRQAANPSAAAVDLMGVVRNLVFTTTVPVLLGDHILPQTQQGMKHFQNQFVQFDNSFEHGAKLPEFLLKEWAKSKHFLLGPFHEVIHKKSGTNLKEDTLLQAMVDLLEGDCAPNYATVLFWASLANAVPITFWTLAFVLSDQSIKEAVQKEVDELLGPYIDRGALAEVPFTEIKKLQIVEQCILEAIRLRSPGAIARKLTQPIQVHGFTVPAGDLLMISPYWSHRSESLFPDADSFVPDRWNQTGGKEKSTPTNKFIAFGGGRFQCPGRSFAMMEMQMFVSVLLCRFDMELVEKKVPLPSPQHVAGVPHPQSQCYVKMCNRVRAEL